MRTITTTENDGRKRLLIKSAQRTRHQKMTEALERTLSRCHDLHAECASGIEKLREATEKEGFSSGYHHFFSQIVRLLDNYEKWQHQRMKDFRHTLMMKLKASLHDPIVVERIIFYLQQTYVPESALKIIIPHGVALPDRGEAGDYQFTDDNHITVTNGTDVIRFPCDRLCQQWFSEAEKEHNNSGLETDDIIADIMAVFRAKLPLLSGGKSENHPNIKEN